MPENIFGRPDNRGGGGRGSDAPPSTGYGPLPHPGSIPPVLPPLPGRRATRRQTSYRVPRYTTLYSSLRALGTLVAVGDVVGSAAVTLAGAAGTVNTAPLAATVVSPLRISQFPGAIQVYLYLRRALVTILNAPPGNKIALYESQVYTAPVGVSNNDHLFGGAGTTLSAIQLSTLGATTTVTDVLANPANVAFGSYDLSKALALQTPLALSTYFGGDGLSDGGAGGIRVRTSFNNGAGGATNSTILYYGNTSDLGSVMVDWQDAGGQLLPVAEVALGSQYAAVNPDLLSPMPQSDPSAVALGNIQVTVPAASNVSAAGTIVRVRLVWSYVYLLPEPPLHGYDALPSDDDDDDDDDGDGER